MDVKSVHERHILICELDISGVSSCLRDTSIAGAVRGSLFGCIASVAAGSERETADTMMAGPLEGKKVGIIGGGPAGMLCAAYMAKHGATVTVLERYDPSQDTDSGKPRPWWNIGLSTVSKTAIEGAGLTADFEAQFRRAPCAARCSSGLPRDP